MSYLDRQKDATYLVVSVRPTPEPQQGAWAVTSMTLRAVIAKGRIVRLQESNRTGELAPHGESEAKAFRRLAFKHQVSCEV